GGEDGEYCEVDGGDTSYGEYITNVQFNGINKDSDDDGGYADHTGSVSDAVEPGESYELSVTMSTGGYSDYISVVIDWDQDYDLSNDEVIEVGNGDSDPTTVSTEITVPSDAVEGETRMRVMQEYQGYHTDPCSDQSYGETEDYTVTVSDSSTMVEETGPEADLADTDEPLIVTGSSLEISAPIDLKTAGSTRIATE
ncbi:MAG: GEVED domain-containing protein, partial [Candidatus Natronoplasma sp.]